MRRLARTIFLRLGLLLARLFPGRNDSGLFFFLPFYHVGGAERVHADILRIASGKKPWIVITNESSGAALREEFSRQGRLFDLSLPAGMGVPRLVLTGYLAGCINRCGSPFVFGANSGFYYELLPHLRAKVRCVDLIHAFGGGIETVSLPYVERLDRRIAITRKTREDLAEQYRLNGIPEALAARIDLVENKVALPAVLLREPGGERLRVLFVGRGGREKRAWLVGRIARCCQERGIPADFTLVGELSGVFPASQRPGLCFLGELHQRCEIERIYRQNDLLLVTSVREGFPMVIMEAMAHGVVAAATDVGGVAHHLKHGENGFLVASGADEGDIVESFVSLIARLNRDRDLLERLSENSRRYAAAHFRGETFDRYYRDLFGVDAEIAPGGTPGPGRADRR